MEGSIKLHAGMHGRDKMAAAPMSDVAMREGRRCLHVREASIFFFVS